MDLANFTYHMQFSLLFLNNNNLNTTHRMDIDVKEINCFNKSINEINIIKDKDIIKSQINRLKNVYDNSPIPLRSVRTDSNSSDEFNRKSYNRHVILTQRLKFKRKLNSKARKSKPKQCEGNIRNVIERRRKKDEADVEKLIELFKKKNISRLDNVDIDIVNINDLKGNRRIKRAMSVLIREMSESEVDMAGLPNQLAPKYQAMRKKKDAITAYGKKYINMTNRNSEEELHFMNYTELKNEVMKEKEAILLEAQELIEFYDLEQEEEHAEWMQNIGSYHVDLSQLELKCDLMNNVTGLEYRIHNPELYPGEDVHTNLEKLKVAEDKVYALEKKQLDERRRKAEEYHKLVARGRTTAKRNLTTQSVYLRSRYLWEQEQVFGTLFKRFTRTRAEKERAYARLKRKPKTTHFREYFGLDYLENWYQKGKTFGDFGQDSNADLHLLRQSGFRSALYSNIQDGPYNYLN